MLSSDWLKLKKVVTKTEKGWLDNWDGILKIVNFWLVLWVNLFQYKTGSKNNWYMQIYEAEHVILKENRDNKVSKEGKDISE